MDFNYKLYNRIVSKLHASWHSARERRQLTSTRTKNDDCMAWRCYNRQDVFIYTPTYNRATILSQRAIPSVLTQTYSNYVYMVVGDGCTDGTAQYMAFTHGHLSHVRFVNIRRGRRGYPDTPECRWLCGPVKPANFALEAARRDLSPLAWIARIDDDDTWIPEHLERCLKYALDNNLEFVSAWNEETRDGITSVIKDDPRLPGIGATSTWVYRSYLSFFRYDKSCWRKSVNRVNDTDLAERMRNAGVRMGQLPEVHCFTKPRPGNTQVGLKAYLGESE